MSTSAQLANEPVTDVFSFQSWLAGRRSGRGQQQYSGWLQAMATCEVDRQRIRTLRPGSVRYSSYPLAQPAVGRRTSGKCRFLCGGSTGCGDQRVINEYAAVLGDTDEVRGLVRAIIEAAYADGEPDRLPSHVLAAYTALDAAVGLPKAGVAAAPGADWDVFDPEGIYQAFRADAATAAASASVCSPGVVCLPRFASCRSGK